MFYNHFGSDHHIQWGHSYRKVFKMFCVVLDLVSNLNIHLCTLVQIIFIEFNQQQYYGEHAILFEWQTNM